MDVQRNVERVTGLHSLEMLGMVSSRGFLITGSFK